MGNEGDRFRPAALALFVRTLTASSRRQGRRRPARPRVLNLCGFVDYHRDEFLASNTSTGIVKVESSLGPATAELPAGVTRLAPLLG